MKNQKFSKNPKFFAFYLESSKNVLALRTPGNERNTSQIWQDFFFGTRISRFSRRLVTRSNLIYFRYSSQRGQPTFASSDIQRARGANPRSRTLVFREPEGPTHVRVVWYSESQRGQPTFASSGINLKDLKDFPKISYIYS